MVLLCGSGRGATGVLAWWSAGGCALVVLAGWLLGG